jgi:hypothetical protein
MMFTYLASRPYALVVHYAKLFPLHNPIVDAQQTERVLL